MSIKIPCLQLLLEFKVFIISVLYVFALTLNTANYSGYSLLDPYCVSLIKCSDSCNLISLYEINPTLNCIIDKSHNWTGENTECTPIIYYSVPIAVILILIYIFLISIVLYKTRGMIYGFEYISFIIDLKRSEKYKKLIILLTLTLVAEAIVAIKTNDINGVTIYVLTTGLAGILYSFMTSIIYESDKYDHIDIHSGKYKFMVLNIFKYNQIFNNTLMTRNRWRLYLLSNDNTVAHGFFDVQDIEISPNLDNDMTELTDNESMRKRDSGRKIDEEK
jgi:hypothetical protein